MGEDSVQNNGNPYEPTRSGRQARAACLGVAAFLLARLAGGACAEHKSCGTVCEGAWNSEPPLLMEHGAWDCMLSVCPARRSHAFAAQPLGRSSTAFFQACARRICKAIICFQAPAWVDTYETLVPVAGPMHCSGGTHGTPELSTRTLLTNVYLGS